MVTAEHRQRHGALAAMELRSHARRGFSTSSANNASLKPPTRFCFGLHAIVRLSRALTTAFVPPAATSGLAQ